MLNAKKSDLADATEAKPVSGALPPGGGMNMMSELQKRLQRRAVAEEFVEFFLIIIIYLIINILQAKT